VGTIDNFVPDMSTTSKEREPIQCSCGASLKSRQGIRAHVRGPRHRQRKRVLTLIKKGSLSFAAVGKRFGLTRERVRQIAKLEGFATGRERFAAEAATRLNGVPRLQALRRAADRAGLEMVVLGSRHVMLNGVACWVRKAMRLVTATGEKWKIDGNVRKAANAAFALFEMAGGEWAIVPVSELPGKMAEFARFPRPGYRKSRWTKYVNAWHLLERRAK
jgi:hypothetical protein